MADNNTRRFPRVPFRARVHCTGEGLYFSDIASNLSEGGIGLQTISQLEPGEELELEFRLPNSEQGLLVRTRVVWVQSNTDDSRTVQCGLSFDEMDDDDRRRVRTYVATNLG